MSSVWLSLGSLACLSVAVYLSPEKIEVLRTLRKTSDEGSTPNDPSDEVLDLVHNDRFWKTSFERERGVKINPRALEVYQTWFKIPQDEGTRAAFEMRDYSSFLEVYPLIRSNSYFDRLDFVRGFARVQAQIGSVDIVKKLLEREVYSRTFIDIWSKAAIQGRNEEVLKYLTATAFYDGNTVFLSVYEKLLDYFEGSDSMARQYVKNSLVTPRADEIITKILKEGNTRLTHEYDKFEILGAFHKASQDGILGSIIDNDDMFQTVDYYEENFSWRPLGTSILTESDLNATLRYSHLYKFNMGRYVWLLLGEKNPREKIRSFFDSYDRYIITPSTKSLRNCLVFLQFTNTDKEILTDFLGRYSLFVGSGDFVAALMNSQNIFWTKKSFLETPLFFVTFERILRETNDTRLPHILSHFASHPEVDPHRYWTALKFLYKRNPHVCIEAFQSPQMVLERSMDEKMFDIFIAFAVKYLLPKDITPFIRVAYERASKRPSKKYAEILGEALGYS